MKLLTPIFILLFLYASTIDAKDTETTKEIWSQLMTIQVPEAFCSPDQYFGSCFKMNNNDCKDFISFSVKQCFKKYDSEIPSILNKHTGTKWGGIIGHCTGSIFETAAVSQDLKIKTSNCTNYNSWKTSK